MTNRPSISIVARLSLAAAVAALSCWFALRMPPAVGARDRAGEELEATNAAEALRWYNDQRAYPAGTIPPAWREKALSTMRANALKQPARQTAALAWTSVGPANIGGRVRSIAIDSANHLLYCGSVSGGIWRSSNNGLSWTPLTDLASNIVIGSIAIDPVNPMTIYAGTGEGYFNVDALRGIGVLKTTDGGANWSVLSNFLGASGTVAYINKLLIRPDNHNILYAAVSAPDVGIWRSLDAGANWTKQPAAGGSGNPGGSAKFCTDLVMDPNNPDVMYGAFGLFNTNGIWKTTNGGTTWSKLTAGFPSTSTKYLRISLDIARSNPQILYACLSDSSYNTHSIQKTTDGGASWLSVATPFDNDPLISATHLGGQGWYNNVIAVDPTNPDIVFTGGINLFRSFDGGVSWTRVSDGYAGGIHVDQHAIAFDPVNHQTIYFGNDGGMYKTANGGSSFADLNGGLTITQFYSGAVHPSADIYYGGTQDNGTLRTSTPPNWTQVFSGDGGVTIVDPVTPSTVFTEYVYLAIQKSTNDGVNFTRSINGIPTTGPNASNGTSDRCGFIAPFAIDPSNPSVLVAGTYRVFRTTNGGDFWSTISPDLTGEGPGAVGSSGSVITALAVARTSSAIIFAGTSGFDSSSRVLMTTNTGLNWSNLTKPPLPRRYVKAIAAPTANSVVVTYSGYDANTPTTPGHVFRTTNRGTTWANISGNLPDIPVNCVLLDSASNDHMLVGTDLGVFETADGGTSWAEQNGGLAHVSVADLDIRRDGIVLAATHGRGMFRSTTPFGSRVGTGLSIVIHQNPVLTRYIDLFVTASESLSSPPSMTITGGAPSPEIIPIAPHSYRVYKGDYAFSSNGTITLTAIAQDSLSQDLISTRILQGQLLKRTEGGSVQSPDGEVTLRIASTSLEEDTYFTVIPEAREASIVGLPYAFGPGRTIGSATLAFRLPDQLGGLEEQHFTVLRKTDLGWSPVQSSLDLTRREVTAQTSTLGTFALGYREGMVTPALPTAFRLDQNYPNPFNPSTTIRFAMPQRAAVRLAVYDVAGREIRTLLDTERDAGEFTLAWDGRNGAGIEAASGIYFYALTARVDDGRLFRAAGKMMLLK